MQLVYETPKCVKDDFIMTYCAGCDHGVALKLIAEVIDELGLKEDTIAISSIGCSVFLNDFFDLDILEAPHGRALASATGAKRSKPHKTVFTYQGDGDFASIGLGESLHAASRGEKVTTICINNTTFGMTGGQAGPTTILGQVTTTTPKGRNADKEGYPIKIAEMVAQCDGAVYVTRVSLTSVSEIKNAKKAIKKAFETQKAGLGFAFVEILATCPTNWKMSPQEAHEYIKEKLCTIYPLGTLKDY